MFVCRLGTKWREKRKSTRCAGGFLLTFIRETVTMKKNPYVAAGFKKKAHIQLTSIQTLFLGTDAGTRYFSDDVKYF